MKDTKVPKTVKTREERVRRLLKKDGYVLLKNRARAH